VQLTGILLPVEVNPSLKAQRRRRTASDSAH
jgi:hypothetical protein